MKIKFNRTRLSIEVLAWPVRVVGPWYATCRPLACSRKPRKNEASSACPASGGKLRISTAASSAPPSAAAACRNEASCKSKEAEIRYHPEK